MRNSGAENLSGKKGLPVVLIVEDDEGLNRLIQKAISGRGFRTERASNSLEVIEKIKKNPDMILLLDYMLPDTTGKQIIERLAYEGYKVPFVIMTGHGDERVAVEMMKLGARDYVIKDKDFIEILSEVVKKISSELERDLALENTRHALAKREKALAAVYNIATNTGKSYQELCEYSSRKLAEILSLSAVVTFIAQNNEIVSLARFVEGAMLKLEDSEIPCSNCSAIMKKKKAFQLTGDLSERLLHCTCFCPGYHSFVAVPIKKEENVHGMICAFDSEEREFTSDELQLIDLFAHYLCHEIDQKNMEEEIRQGREMKILGRLTSGVAHEVRNPLNAINAMIEAMYEEFQHNEDMEPYKYHISSQVERLSRLMQDLLDLGKPVDRENVAPVPIGKLCVSTVEMWEKTARTTRKVEFRDVDGVEDREILIDQNKMQQVLINLLENASQHSPENGKISLELSRANDNHISVKIIDRGCGIPPEHINNLFEPFFTTRRQGTGLGLSIVRHIVTTHGGKIAVYNNSDTQGSTFEITFPTQ